MTVRFQMLMLRVGSAEGVPLPDELKLVAVFCAECTKLLWRKRHRWFESTELPISRVLHPECVNHFAAFSSGWQNGNMSKQRFRDSMGKQDAKTNLTELLWHGTGAANGTVSVTHARASRFRGLLHLPHLRTLSAMALEVLLRHAV